MVRKRLELLDPDQKAGIDLLVCGHSMCTSFLEAVVVITLIRTEHNGGRTVSSDTFRTH